MMSPEKMAADPVMKDENKVAGNREIFTDQMMNCPRCDSPDTKFCYYNNYSLSQPRYICKTCRRYWTKGGALRNVPIGGGCRKSKKVKTSARLAGDDTKNINLSAEISGLKHLNGHPLPMDFHFGGSSSNSLMGFNYSLLTGIYGGQYGSSIQTMNSTSLNVSTMSDQKLQPIFSHNLDFSEPDQIEKAGHGRKEGDTATEWLFGNSYATGNGGGAAIDDPGNGSWNEIQAWNNHLSSHGDLP